MDVTSAIQSLVCDKRPGGAAWFDRLPDDGREALGKFRDDYRAGRVSGQKKAIALAVIEYAKEKGWRTSGVQGVIAWLDQPTT